MKQLSTMKHKLTPIPTALEQTYKVTDGAETNMIESDLEILEQELISNKKKRGANLPVINKTKQRKPLVKSVSLESETFRKVLDKILSLQDPESFLVITLLYEYMEMKKSFKIDKITGTELLKMSGYKSKPNQKQRDKILSCILQHSNTTISVLNPEKTSKNYKNKETEEGRSYRHFTFLRVKESNYSKTNPDLIVSLEGIELLPGYIDFLPAISRRYIPLEQIRKIPKRSTRDKGRHFITKVCFKFASIKGNSFDLNLEECMNLGKFYTSSTKKRLWKPIIKALQSAQELQLLKFKCNLRQPTNKEIKRDRLKLDVNGIIIDSKKEINEILYKYIQSITFIRTYELDYKIDLPFDLEQEKAVKPTKIRYY